MTPISRAAGLAFTCALALGAACQGKTPAPPPPPPAGNTYYWASNGSDVSVKLVTTPQTVPF